MQNRWALFFSGRGSNLEAILKTYCKTWSYPPVLVSDNPKSKGIKVAESYGLTTHILKKPIDYKLLSTFLKEQKVDHIFLLGYLKIIPASFLSDWTNNIFNLHPSLLPAYPGLQSIERAYEEKKAIGITIHRVTEGVDQGQILMQQKIFEDQSFDHLSLEEVKSIVHSKEHKLVCDFILKGETQFGSKV